jgi:hypothetical protein
MTLPLASNRSSTLSGSVDQMAALAVRATAGLADLPKRRLDRGESFGGNEFVTTPAAAAVTKLSLSATNSEHGL